MAVLSRFQPSPINTHTDLTMLANNGFADDMSTCNKFESNYHRSLCGSATHPKGMPTQQTESPKVWILP